MAPVDLSKSGQDAKGPAGSRTFYFDCDSFVIKPEFQSVIEAHARSLAAKTSGAHGPREHHNHIFTWDAGDKDATDAVFASAPVVVKEHLHYPRVHPCPLETCGCVASFDPVRGELTTYITSQAPHVVRTVVSLLSGIPESKVRIISPDIGGGSATRSASTRAMSAPSWRRSCWASR